MRQIRKNPYLLKNALAVIDWSKVINTSIDLDSMVRCWTDTIVSILDVLAPETERVIKSRRVRPKLDKETLALIDQKNKLYQKVLDSKKDGKVDPALFSEYKNLRNHCSNMIRSQIKKALGWHINENSSMNEIWKAISYILNQKCTDTAMKVKGDNDVVVEDSQKIAEMFNIFFRDKPIKLVKKINKLVNNDPNSKLAKKKWREQNCPSNCSQWMFNVC